MQKVRIAGQVSETAKPRELEGLAAWVLTRFRVFRGVRSAEHKRMRLLETLSLGGKRQLMLVECAGERYLVGGSLDSVQTIVRMSGETTASELAECR